MLKSFLPIILGLLCLFGALALLRPVPSIDEPDALVVQGKVTEIFERGGLDIVLRIAGDARTFYIQRGLEKGLDLDQLRQTLVGQEVLLKFPDYWTPLDWNSDNRHVSKLEYDGRVLYTEFR